MIAILNIGSKCYGNLRSVNLTITQQVIYIKAIFNVYSNKFRGRLIIGKHGLAISQEALVSYFPLFSIDNSKKNLSHSVCLFKGSSNLFLRRLSVF